MNMEYSEFISKLENGNISKVRFCVKDYNHYRNCCIRCFNDIFSFRGRQLAIPTIEVKLTNDNSELVSFIDEFDEKYRLFNINKNKYTLKEIWDKIEIFDIE